VWGLLGVYSGSTRGEEAFKQKGGFIGYKPFLYSFRALWGGAFIGFGGCLGGVEPIYRLWRLFRWVGGFYRLWRLFRWVGGFYRLYMLWRLFIGFGGFGGFYRLLYALEAFYRLWRLFIGFGGFL
jgi:hypothetical protein